MSPKRTILLESLRLRIYDQLAGEGRVDSLEQIISQQTAQHLSEPSEVMDALYELETNRHLVLSARGEVELAHPFGTRDFGFSVKSDDVLWWGGCAWDAFAIPNLVPGASPSLIATTCPACATAHAWNVTDEAAPEGTQVAHFLVPMAHVWDDVIHACENQRIFCSEQCVDDWVDSTGHVRGSVFSLSTLWKLSADWYSGRLDRGYQRRQPEEAADYFRSVGLIGAFWDNGDAGEGAMS